MKYAALFVMAILFASVYTDASALGNHPESNTCPTDKPYFVFCSHSLHSLEGWYGGCYSTREEAEKAAVKHAEQEHNGNTRWTGVKIARQRRY